MYGVWSALSAEYGSTGYTVTNPARGQLKRETLFCTPSPFTPENSISRDRFGRPVLRQSDAHSPHSGWIWSPLTGFLAPSAMTSTYTVNRHRVSPKLIGSRNCVPMTFTAESPPAQGQGFSRYNSSSNGGCLFRFSPWTIFFMRLSFPAPTTTVM